MREWSVEGDELFDEIEKFLSRFVAYPSEAARVAHTLWIIHAHCMDAWDSTPRIAFLSPEPGSGKTRAMEITETLVPHPVEAVNTTPAYLFRKVSDPDGLPTILYDEIDTLFGPRAKDNEEIRGMLNAGHRRGAMAGRCVVHGLGARWSCTAIEFDGLTRDRSDISTRSFAKRFGSVSDTRRSPLTTLPADRESSRKFCRRLDALAVPAVVLQWRCSLEICARPRTQVRM